jgi:hypothetical protein
MARPVVELTSVMRMTATRPAGRRAGMAIVRERNNVTLVGP